MLRTSSPSIQEIVAATSDPHEIIAMQKALSGAPTLLVKMDADGCFYGFRFNLLIKNIALTFRKEFQNISTMGQADRELLLASIRELIKLTNIEEWSNTDTRKRPTFERLISDNLLHQSILVLRSLDPDLLCEILYRTNQALVEKIIAEARRDKCVVVAFSFGTSRQSRSLDCYNAQVHGTGFFMEDMHRFTAYLNKLHHEKMEFMLDRFLLADAYNELPSGETFRRALAGLSNAELALEHPATVYDFSKSNVILDLNRLEFLLPGAKRALMFDDCDDVINKLAEIFEHQDFLTLLPSKLPLTIILYDGDFYPAHPDFVIKGTGPGDKDCASTLRKLVSVAGGDLDEMRKKEGLSLDFSKPEHLAKVLKYLQGKRLLTNWNRSSSGKLFDHVSEHSPKSDPALGKRFH